MHITFDPDFDSGAPWPDAGADALIDSASVGPLGLLDILETQTGSSGRYPSNAERALLLLDAIEQRPGFWSQSARVDAFGTAVRLLSWRDELCAGGWRGERLDGSLAAGVGGAGGAAYVADAAAGGGGAGAHGAAGGGGSDGGTKLGELGAEEGTAELGTEPGTEEGTERLAELAAVTRAVAPGVVDRLWALVELLEQGRRRLDIERIELLEPEAGLGLVWRRLLAALRQAGVTVVEREPEAVAAAAGSDLAGCQQGDFEPRGDGSLQLLRTGGWAEAAEEAAAWLAAAPAGESAVVIWPDPVLDHALQRHGLPTLGGASALHGSSLLAVLPLVVELGWWPPDARLAHQLLLLPLSPIRRSAARRLAAALQDWPLVGGPEWSAALAAALEAIEDPAERAKVAERIAVVFERGVQRDQPYPAAELGRRVALVERWARGYQAVVASNAAERAGQIAVGIDEQDGRTPDPHSGPRPRDAWRPEDFAPLMRQCAVLRGLMAASGRQAFAPRELGFMLERSTEAAGAAAVHPARAGLTALGAPGALTAPVDRVLCWDFSLSRHQPPAGVPLAPAERRALQAAGVELSDARQQARRRARRWLRPLHMARRAVLCVCPRRSRIGEDEFAHPAWDAIAARAGAHAGRLQADRLLQPPAREPRRPRPPLQPQAGMQLEAGSVARRERESASSLEKLLRCPLAHTLRYPARLKPGPADPPPAVDGPLLLGSLAHRVLARVLEPLRAGRPLAPEQAAAAARAELERGAAGLFLPGQEQVRKRLELRPAAAAASLAECIAAGGLRVVGLEHELQGTAAHLALQGRIDLLLDGPPAVVDFKWSGATKKRQALERNTAVQLAVYARLARPRADAPLPAVAYYLIDGDRLLASEHARLPGAEPVAGAEPEQCWAALAPTAADLFAELAAGRVAAPGNDEAPRNNDSIADGRLRLAPQCGYCDYSALCGRLFGGR